MILYQVVSILAYIRKRAYIVYSRARNGVNNIYSVWDVYIKSSGNGRATAVGVAFVGSI